MPLFAELGIKGSPIGIVGEAPPDCPDGRHVDSRPASGGRAYSQTDSMGKIKAKLSGPLLRGSKGEFSAKEVLTQALIDNGNEVHWFSDSEDSRGEDGSLSINRKRVPVQIVSIPLDEKLWRQLSKNGTVTTEGVCLEFVHKALCHKKDKARGTLLVLDAAQFGAIVGTGLVENYFRAYGDPACQFYFREVWIVGPTVRSTIRLYGKVSRPS